MENAVGLKPSWHKIDDKPYGTQIWPGPAGSQNFSHLSLRLGSRERNLPVDGDLIFSS